MANKNSMRTTRLSGQFIPFVLQRKNTAGAVGSLTALDTGVTVQTNNTGCNMTFSNLFGSASRPALEGALFSEWKVNKLTFEFYPFSDFTSPSTSVARSFALAGNQDPNEAAYLDANIPAYTRFVEEQKMVLIHPSAVYDKSPAKIVYSPPVQKQWLFIQRNSESTAATNRMCSAGSLLCLCDTASTGSGETTYGYFLCKYDISLRGMQFSESITAFKVLRQYNQIDQAARKVKENEESKRSAAASIDPPKGWFS